MNKKVVIGVVVAIIIIAAGAVFFISSNNKQLSDTDDGISSLNSGKKFAAVKACELLTLADAKQLLGDDATLGTATAPASTADINVDTCSYTNNAASVPLIRTATVMVRSALTNDGLESNKAAFEAGGAANPNGATAVAGYGDRTFWDPATHQLAILEDNAWIGVVYGGTNPANNTLEDAKKVADLVLN